MTQSAFVRPVCLALTLLSQLWSLDAVGGGTVNFNNKVPSSGIDAPVFAADRVTRLSDTNYVAQLYGGLDAAHLEPGLPIATFRGATAPGYVRSPSPVTFDNVTGGATCFVQMRVWDSTAGATYEQALAARGSAGSSKMIQVHTGDPNALPPTVPGDLIGLESFQVSAGPIRVEVTPVSQVAFEGQSVRLVGSVKSTSPYTCQWQHGGVDLPGATNLILELPALSLGATGTYDLLVRPAGQETPELAAAVVSVLSSPNQPAIWFQNRVPQFGVDAPVLAADGVSRIAGAGFVAQLYVGSTNMSLVAQGKPVPFGTGNDAGYWMESEEFWRALADQTPGSTVYVQVRVWETAMGTNYETAGLNGGTVGASDVFAVVLGGPGTSTPYPTLLTQLSSFRVDKLPRILSQPSSFVHVLVNSRTEVSVNLADSITPMTYQWFKGGEPILEATSYRLTIEPTRFDDAGLYTLEIHNAGGTVTSKGFQLVVSAFEAETGLVSFTNFRTTAGVNALITDSKGSLVQGPAYWAQLYASNVVAECLTAVGSPIEFDANQPGAFGSEREVVVGIPWVSPGQPALVQVRVWESPQGELYESAATNNLQHGASEFFEITTGGFSSPPIPPADLTPMKPFQLVQESRLKVVTPEIQALVGSDAILVVEAQGPKVLGCAWYFGDQKLKDTATPRLTLSQLRVDQSGTYRVVVTNELETLTSDPIQLVVIAPTSGGTVIFANRLIGVGLDAPVFDIDGVTRLSGGNYLAQLYSGITPSFLVAVEGYAKLGQGLAAGYFTSTNPARALPNVGPSATAYLQIRVWDSAVAPTYEEAVALNGRAGSSLVFSAVTGGAGSPPGFPTELLELTSFRVKQGAVIVQQPEDEELFAGQNLVLKAVVTSSSPVSFRWTHNGEPIDGVTSATLTIPNVATSTAGNYQFVASNADRSVASRLARVHVAPSIPTEGSVLFKNWVPSARIDAPVFIDFSTVRLEGTNFVAQLYAEPYASTGPSVLTPVGEPAPFGTGEDAGHWLPGDHFWRTIPGMAPGALVWLQVRVWDITAAPSFEAAQATDSILGSSQINVFTLGGPGALSPYPTPLDVLGSFLVGHLPSITQQPTGGKSKLGQTKVLKVQAQSAMPLGYQWYKNGAPVPSATHDTLTLTLFSTEQSGNYSVEVSNQYGKRSSEIAVVEVVKPVSGTILFSNNRPDLGIVAPILGQDGVTPLEGTNYLAQLMVGLNRETMVPVGRPVPFGVGTNAGYIDLQGGDPAVQLGNVEPGVTVNVSMVAWHRAYGESCVEAAFSGGLIGYSTNLILRTGGEGTPPSAPTPLSGLTSFRLRMTPYFLGYSGDILVMDGEPIILEVVPAEGVLGTIQWYVAPSGNGPWTVINSANSWSLSLGTLPAGTTAVYQMTLSTLDGPVTSPPMQVYVGSTLPASPDGWKDLKLPISTEHGPVYSVERSTNLLAWSPILTLTNDNGTVQISDPGASNSTAAFYRVRSEANGTLVSTKTVGFVVWEIPYGYSMRALPLFSGHNTVGELLKDLPTDVMAYKYHPGLGFSIIMWFEGEWLNTADTIQPGEGIILRNASVNTYRITLVGEVPEIQQTRALPAGWSIQSALFPREGRVDTDLGMPLQKGDNIDRLDTFSYNYLPYLYIGNGQWDSHGTPQVNIGEAFWLYRSTPGVWTNTYVHAP